MRFRSSTALTTRVLLAVLVAALLALALPAYAGAVFTVSAYSHVSTTSQAVQNPTVTTKFTRNGTKDEDLRDVRIEFPKGQLINPQGPTVRCTDEQLNLDQCSPDSNIGGVKVLVQRDWAWNPRTTIPGSLYIMSDPGAEHAVIGFVLRPSIAPKQAFKQVLTFNLDQSTQVLTTALPTMLGTWNITVLNMAWTFNSRAHPLKTGPRVMLNPSDCAVKTPRVTLTSHQNVTVSASQNWTTTGCAAAPYSATAQITPTSDAADEPSGVTIAAQVPSTAEVRQSTVKSIDAAMPEGSGLNYAALGAINGGLGCSEAELAANACPAATRVGGATADFDMYPPTFTGDVYLMGTVGATADLAMVLDGPRGIHGTIRGQASVTGAGPTARAHVKWDAMPNVPFQQVQIDISEPLFINPDNCVSPVTADATLTGYAHSDAMSKIVTVSDSYQLTCSPADTQITSGPEGGLGIADPTPEWQFASDLPGATFECSLDGAAWSACTSPYQVLDDRINSGPNGFDTGDGAGGEPNAAIDADETGSHTFGVRAIYDGYPDASPDTATFGVGVFNPIFAASMVDPADLGDTGGNDAIAHPDLTLTSANAVGDLAATTVSVPDYTWLSKAAAAECATADALAGACAEASRIGDIALTAAVNRLPHDGIAPLHTLALTGPVYLTNPWNPGDFSGAVAEVDVIDGDGRNYGKVNLRLFSMIDNISTDNTSTTGVEENTSVSNARGLLVWVEGLPALSPGAADGAQLELHGRSVATTLWGNRSHYAKPLFTNSSDCLNRPSPDTGRPVEWRTLYESGEHTGTTETDSVEVIQPYSVDNCADVAFAPLVEQFEAKNAANPLQTTSGSSNPPPRMIDANSDGTPETPTPITLEMRLGFPAENSALRRATIDLPPSLKPRIPFGGYPELCAKDDAQQNVDRDLDGDGSIDEIDYVNCDVGRTRIATAEIVSPLFAAPVVGDVFIQDEPLSTLPQFYAVFNDPDLGLNTRIRLQYDTVSTDGGFGFVRMSLNTNAAPWQADMPGIPITELTLKIDGSSTHGPYFEVNSGCMSRDAVTVNAISWSDDNADGDNRTASMVGPQMHFGNASSPCLPIDTDLADDPGVPEVSPVSGDVTADDTPTWTANRTYTNLSGASRFVWFECSTNNQLWRSCGSFTNSENETQRLVRSPSGTLVSCSSCTYQLTFDGQTTTSIARAAPGATVQAALDALSNIDPGDVTVTGTAPSTATTSYAFKFGGQYAHTDVPEMVVTVSGSPWATTGGAPVSLAVTTPIAGADGDWWTQVDSVPAGATFTHTRIVGPQAANLPLATAAAHKFSVRLKSNDIMPSRDTVDSGNAPGVAESYPSPYPLAPAIEVAFKVDTGVPTGTSIIGGPADGATTSDSPAYLFKSDDITARFQCSVDSSSWTACVSGRPLSGSPFAPGSSHSFEVRAWDGVNADATTVTRSFSVSP